MVRLAEEDESQSLLIHDSKQFVDQRNLLYEFTSHQNSVNLASGDKYGKKLLKDERQRSVKKDLPSRRSRWRLRATRRINHILNAQKQTSKVRRSKRRLDAEKEIDLRERFTMDVHDARFADIDTYQRGFYDWS